MNRRLLFMSICLMFLFVMGACSKKDHNDSDTGNERNEKKMTIMLDWYPNAVHSYLYVAKEKGYFKEEGLDVEFQFPANPTDPLTLAASSNITMGLYYQPDVIMAKANEDIPIVAVSAVVREPLNHIVYRSNDPINSPKELEDKQVGYPGIPINEALVKTVVEHDGGDYGKVDMINVEFELGSSLISEKVEAVSGMFVNHEVPLLRSQGYDVDFINPVDYGVPSYYEVVAVTSEETWENEEEDIESFWRAARKGFEFMVEHPEDALQILLDHQDEANFPLDKDVEMESMNILLPKMKSELGFGSQDKQLWEETAKWLNDYGLIDSIPNMDEFVKSIE